jgi:integrase
MRLYRRAGSPFWHYDFGVKGLRFRGSTGEADQAAARSAAKRRKEDEKLSFAGGTRRRLRLTQAIARYSEEVAVHQASRADVNYQARNLVAGLGDRWLHQPIGDKLAEYVARRRLQVSDASTNREVELLRRIYRRADLAWKADVDMPRWTAYLLPEPDDAGNPLSYQQERDFFAALRPDFHPLFRFAILTGLRLGNLVRLQWTQIDWDAMTIRFRVKSRQPGGKVKLLPITKGQAAILGAERGKHPRFVFTYRCARRRRDPHTGLLQAKGSRHPFTMNGWRRAFMLARDAAGLPHLRFHDLRHTAGARITREKGLKVAKDALMHESIATTARYAKYQVEELRAALEAVEKTAQQGHINLSDAREAAEKKGG